MPQVAWARPPAPGRALRRRRGSVAASDRPRGRADGLVHKEAPAEELYEALRMVARGASWLPPLDRRQLDAAAHRVDAEDLALLAMLVDRTEPSEVAATLRMDRRKLARRIERVLGRLRPASPRPV